MSNHGNINKVDYMVPRCGFISYKQVLLYKCNVNVYVFRKKIVLLTDDIVPFQEENDK